MTQRPFQEQENSVHSRSNNSSGSNNILTASNNDNDKKMTVEGFLVAALLLCTQLDTTLTKCKKPSCKDAKDPFTDDVIDDAVLHVAATRKKERTLGMAPDIPALTDRSFSATVYNPDTQLVVVLFYIPFDAVGMLFLQHYQQVGRELAALKGNNSSTSHPLVRVNCYDWTDVCRKEKVTSYPVIHVYRRGKWRQRYWDALDKDVLVRSVFLLQCEQPLWLRTEREVELFVDGRFPRPVHHMVNNLVLLRPSRSMAEVGAFTEVVRELETQMLFAIVSPGVQSDIGAEAGVLHVRRTDKHQPRDTLTQDLQPHTIRHFLVTGKFPLLPELTFLNFPELQARHQPLGILFRNPTHPHTPRYMQKVADVIRSGHVHNVTFCTMAVDADHPMADQLLRTYTGRTALPVFVLVNLTNRTVYVFTERAWAEQNLTSWLLGAQDGKFPPTNRLARGQFQPSGRHYDFLAKMDKDRERKEKTDRRRFRTGQKERSSSDSDTAGEDDPTLKQHHDQKPNQDSPNQNQNSRNDNRELGNQNLNQNRKHQNDNLHDPNRKQHGANQNGNKNHYHNPNQHTRHPTPKLKPNTKVRHSREDAEWDREHKRNPPHLSGRMDSSRIPSRDRESIRSRGRREGKEERLRIEL